MKIAIIGSGNVGKALAKSSVKAGHNVTMTATSAEKAAEAAKATGAHAANSNQEAVKDADLVIVAVPYDKLGEVFRGLGTAVDGKVVVDATNHINTENPGEVLNGISNAEEIQKRHPKVHVVKAFNYSFAARMAEPSVGGTRLDGFVAGDDQAAKAKVLEFVGSIGYRPIDAGPLVMARALESMGLLIVMLQIKHSWPWQNGWKLVGPPED
jgi:NADPH-dependent F420 reductase